MLNVSVWVFLSTVFGQHKARTVDWTIDWTPDSIIGPESWWPGVKGHLQIAQIVFSTYQSGPQDQVLTW